MACRNTFEKLVTYTMTEFRLVFFLLMPFVWACNGKSNIDEKTDLPPEVSLHRDSAHILNDTILILETDRSIVEKRGRVIKLITNPLNLKLFKTYAGSANGRVKKQLPFYYKPDTVGTYYEYFWFHALRRTFGENKSVDYLFIETYIYGDKIGQYTTVKEALISIRAKVSHNSLGTINLVGKSRNEMEFLYGLPHFKRLQKEVYYHQNSFLILSYRDEKIEWFRYIRTNLTLEQAEELPIDYFEYNSLH